MKKFVSSILGVVFSGIIAMSGVIGMTISASAAEAAPTVQTAAMQIVEMPQIQQAAAVISAMPSMPHIVPLAGAADTGGTAAGSGEVGTFATVMTFLITWIRRIGLAIAFIGAIMFGLAIKDDDARGKQSGLMTLAAGFIVAAVCTAADMFGFFT